MQVSIGKFEIKYLGVYSGSENIVVGLDDLKELVTQEENRKAKVMEEVNN